MEKNILNYINKLQAYKTAIKNLHWSSKRMSEHKLLDEIADSLSTNQDEIAEIAQGIYGKIKINQLKPKRYKISNSKKMLNDLTKDTKDFCETLKSKNLTGLRSVVESFIGELNKFDYLMDMCIKEDIKRRYKNNINEEKNIKMKSIRLTEEKLRKIIGDSIKKVIKENISFNKKMEGKIFKMLYKNFLNRTIKFDYFYIIDAIMQRINEMDGVEDVTINDENGLDLQNNSGNRRKEFILKIMLIDGSILTCQLICNLVYRMDDSSYPIYYDITSNIYNPNKEDDIELA